MNVLLITGAILAAVGGGSLIKIWKERRTEGPAQSLIAGTVSVAILLGGIACFIAFAAWGGPVLP